MFQSVVIYFKVWTYHRYFLWNLVNDGRSVKKEMYQKERLFNINLSFTRKKKNLPRFFHFQERDLTLDITCITFISFVTWLWHVALHNERSDCPDTVVLRYKNTMSDLEKGTRQNMQTAPDSTESSPLNKKQLSSDLQHIILTGLSVPITKRVSNIDSLFWFWVCLCVEVSDGAGAVRERGVGSVTSCIYL